MKVKIKTIDPLLHSPEQVMKFHNDQANYYCKKFNKLPIFQVRRRELAQLLCEAHAERVLRLNAGDISYREQRIDYLEYTRRKGLEMAYAVHK